VIKLGFRISRLWESPYLRSPDIQDRDGARSMIQIFPLINGCDQVRISRFVTFEASLPLFSGYPRLQCLQINDPLSFWIQRFKSSRDFTLCLFDSCGVPSTLTRIPDLCTFCNRFLRKTWFLRVTVHDLQQSLCTPYKRQVLYYPSRSLG
jgi:hypothetical protein